MIISETVWVFERLIFGDNHTVGLELGALLTWPKLGSGIGREG